MCGRGSLRATSSCSATQKNQSGYCRRAPREPGFDTRVRFSGRICANLAAASEILFDEDLDAKWERAIATLGVSPAMLSTESGRA